MFAVSAHDGLVKVRLVGIDAPEIRRAIPGISWNSVERFWTMPLTRRTTQALRIYLTGKPVQIDSHTASVLKATADGPVVPDITKVKDRIVVSFEFHVKYQNLMKSLGATLRKDNSWSLPLDAAADLIMGIESQGLDLVVHPDVKELTRPKPFGRFTGALTSLKNIDITELNIVQKNPKSKKKSLEDRLRAYGINNMFDLVTYFPLRYIDRSNPLSVRDLVEGENGAVVGSIAEISSSNPAPKRYMTKVVVVDHENTRISLNFFNDQTIARKHHVGQKVIVSGKYSLWTPSKSQGRGIHTFNTPRIDPLDFSAGKTPIIPVYPQSEKHGISTWDISALMSEAFTRMGAISDFVPASMLSNAKLIDEDKSLRGIHFPAHLHLAKQSKDRLIYDELLRLQTYILGNKTAYDQSQGISQAVNPEGYMMSYIKSLPYELTGAQKRVLNESNSDLRSPKPMHRLLQGDVSSGKTTIAHAMMLNAVDNNHQGVILAPTEILAEQLYIGLVEATKDIDVRVEFLGTKVKPKYRESLIQGLADGDVDILVGTHAVLVDDVQFKDLSMVVIDEQHRFGANQRSILRSRRSDGRLPDMLVMTATPIPRTGAMVIYGDLDLSVLDELPPGRIPIATEWIEQPSEEAITDYFCPAWGAIREQIEQGRQAYVVASLVEDNETIAAASVDAAYETLNNGPLSGLRLGIMHGKMPRKEREQVMLAFANKEIDVLIATTVIEVGVNVPNASVMVVLEAGRFGIAQLHQIRGRVGRASYQSTCYLIGDPKNDDGRARLQALVESTDGFYLAEKDLSIRGEGALFGSRQSGVSDLKLTSLLHDLPTLEIARKDAATIITEHPQAYAAIQSQIDVLYSDKEIKS